MDKPDRSGQALVFILLIVVVAVTIGLAVAARTITDVKLSTQTELSQRAFTAAEAGIEDALRRDLVGYSGCDNDGSLTPLPDCPGLATAQFNVNITPTGGGQVFQTETPVNKDDVIELNLDGSGVSLGLLIYWIKSGSTDELENPLGIANPASIEISTIYQDASPPGNWFISKTAYNPSGTCATVARSNGFSSAPGCGSFAVGTKTYTSQSGTLDTCAPGFCSRQRLRIKPLYNQASIAVTKSFAGPPDLPPQGYQIESTGTAGEVTRKIKVTKSLPYLGPLFDFVLYSGGSLQK